MRIAYPRKKSLLFILGVTSLWLFSRISYALPIETFNIPSETRCKGERTCKRGLTSASSLGGYLGIEVTNPAEGTGVSLLELKTGPTKGRVVWGASGNPAGRVTFSWDGDPNGGQISGAGLGCLDITADGATAFILEDLAYTATCSKGKDAAEQRQEQCPPLVVETRMYDAADPTGQRYSTSVIRRQYKFSGEDFRIPFSSFLREGPNGGAHSSCVGAISVTIRADALTKSVVSFGSFYTNGACQSGACLLPPPYSAGVSPIGSPSPTPFATPSVVVTATVLPASVATVPPTATAGRTPLAAATKVPLVQKHASPSLAGTAVHNKAPTPSLTHSRSELPDVGTDKRPGSLEETSTDVPPVKQATHTPLPVTEEYVYGDIIERSDPSPRAAPTATVTSKATPMVDLFNVVP